MKRYLSKTQIAAMRESFNKAFNAMIEKRDMAEAICRKKHHLRQPTMNQLASFSKLVTQNGTCKNFDKIAWFYPPEAYQGISADVKSNDSSSNQTFVFPPEDDSRIQKRKQSSKPRGRYKGGRNDGQE